MAELEPFVRVLHPDALKSLTDSPSFERGERYFREGRVGNLTRQGGSIKAIVRGTTPYDVKIWVRGDQLAYSCTCPSAEQGFFCKHCVAVAFACLRGEPEAEQDPPVQESHAGSRAPPDEQDLPNEAPPRLNASGPKAAPWEPGRVHAFLRKQEPTMLADMLLDQAERDPALKTALMRLFDD